VEIPRTARDSSARRVLLRSIHSRPAISFFSVSTVATSITLGIYVGGDRFIHAPRSGQRFLREHQRGLLP